MELVENLRNETSWAKRAILQPATLSMVLILYILGIQCFLYNFWTSMFNITNFCSKMFSLKAKIDCRIDGQNYRNDVPSTVLFLYVYILKFEVAHTFKQYGIFWVSRTSNTLWLWNCLIFHWMKNSQKELPKATGLRELRLTKKSFPPMLVHFALVNKLRPSRLEGHICWANRSSDSFHIFHL